MIRPPLPAFRTLLAAGLTAVALLAAGCATSGSTTSGPTTSGPTTEGGMNGDEQMENSPVGAWETDVTTSQGLISATLRIAGKPGDYYGSVSSQATGESELQSVQMDGSVLTFQFDNPQYGTIAATVTVDGDRLDGTLDIGEDTQVPISGTRESTDPGLEASDGGRR